MHVILVSLFVLVSKENEAILYKKILLFMGRFMGRVQSGECNKW
jgi:hypothetical protein